MFEPHNHAPSLDHFVGIAGAKHNQTGDRAQRCQMLYRLVRRAIFADANRIMRKDVNCRDFHDRAKSDRRPRIVAENEKTGPVRARAAQRHAVDD